MSGGGGPVLGRRALLLGAGLAAAGAGCTRGGESRAGGGPSGTTAADAGAGDLGLATLAAGLELAAVRAYRAITEAATAGKLGDVPAPVAELLAAAGEHHQHHVDAWNQVVRAGGRPAVITPTARLQPVLAARLARARTMADAVAVARTVEETAAATYLDAVPGLKRADLVTLAASMQAAGAGRAAVLAFLLGQEPAPDVFAKTDDAVRP